MLERSKVLPKFIQCQWTRWALVPTHFLCVYSFPRNSEFSNGKVFSANMQPLGGNRSQELAPSARERSHRPPSPLGSAGWSPGVPGWPLALTHCFISGVKRWIFQVSNCRGSWSHQFCLLPCRVRNLWCLQRKLVVYGRNLQLYLPKKYQWASLGLQRQLTPY